MDKRSRAKLNLKFAQVDNKSMRPWWEMEEDAPAPTPEAPKPDADTNPNDLVSQTDNNPKGEDLGSNLFGGEKPDVDPEVKQDVITLITIIKELALKFYNLTLSDTEALKIAKENLKDISSRISHIPVEQLTDMIDEHINKIDKGVTNNQKSDNTENANGGGSNAEASMPVNNPNEPPAAQEANPAAPNPNEQATGGDFGKMASKKAQIDDYDDVGDEFAEDYIQDNAPAINSPKEAWLEFVELMDVTEDPILEDIFNNLKRVYGQMPFQHGSFMKTLWKALDISDLQEASDLRHKINICLEKQKGVKRGPGEDEPLTTDNMKLKGIKGYTNWNDKPGFMSEWDNAKLASYYSDNKNSIHRHFNVESLQQFMNVVKFNSDNFEYFVKNNKNNTKNAKPW